jgi:hypothetical protein
LEAKAEQKHKFVQEMINTLEKAIRSSHQPEALSYLQQYAHPENKCIRELINLLIAPKYMAFVALRCVTLKAVQIILKVAVGFLSQGQGNRDSGMEAMRHLVGENLAAEAVQEFVNCANKTEEAGQACDAMLVLAELGPEAFEPALVTKLLELFAVVPERIAELGEVALRVHTWGGAARAELLQAAISHEGGIYLGEVLVQVANKGDKAHQMRAAKIFSGCFNLSNGSQFLHTNDKRVLVEQLLRELPNSAGNVTEFVCFAECYQALISHCEAARYHHQLEAIQLFEELGEDDQCPPEVAMKCTQALAILKTSPLFFH